MSCKLGPWCTRLNSAGLRSCPYEHVVDWVTVKRCVKSRWWMAAEARENTATNSGGKVLSWENRSPQKRNSRPPASVILCWVSRVENVLIIYYASCDLLVCLHFKLVCSHWKKNPRFTAFLDSNLHTRLAIVTGNELGLAFPPRNRPKNFVQIRPRFI